MIYSCNGACASIDQLGLISRDISNAMCYEYQQKLEVAGIAWECTWFSICAP